MIFRVADAKKLVEVLKSHGIAPATGEELGIH